MLHICEISRESDGNDKNIPIANQHIIGNGTIIVAG
jgi:hypothetical protein